jgi:hypothetical protein
MSYTAASAPSTSAPGLLLTPIPTHSHHSLAKYWPLLLHFRSPSLRLLGEPILATFHFNIEFPRVLTLTSMYCIRKGQTPYDRFDILSHS